MNSLPQNPSQIQVSSAPVASAVGNSLYAIGGGVTVFYLLGLLLYAWTGWDKFVDLEPNELGDFLAGGFAPLAFAWLVLGFMQQGVELKQNTDALRLQAQELANTVQQQKELVALGHEQLLKEKLQAQDEQRRQMAAARPKFEFSIPRAAKVFGESINLEIHAKNVGALCSHVRVQSSLRSLSVMVQALEPHSQIWEINAWGPATEPFEVFDFYIKYLDVAGNAGSQLISVYTDRGEDDERHCVYGEDDMRVLGDGSKGV